MSHNPYANAYAVGGVPWSEAEDATLLGSKASGLKWRETADLLPGRTEAAVKCRWRQIGLTPEQRVAIAIKKSTPSIRASRVQSVTRAIVPIEVLEDRERRHSAGNTLTGLLCGDPPKGFSALERRA